MKRVSEQNIWNSNKDSVKGMCRMKEGKCMCSNKNNLMKRFINQGYTRMDKRNIAFCTYCIRRNVSVEWECGREQFINWQEEE